MVDAADGERDEHAKDVDSDGARAVPTPARESHERHACHQRDAGGRKV
jgi:hypothetical protein